MANEPISQLRRGRTRDYTIPVRLNQVQSSYNLGRQRTRDGVMQQLISIITYLLVLFVLIAATKVEQSHCDNHLLNNRNKPSLEASSTSLSHTVGKQSVRKIATAIDTTSNKKSRLAILGENIERQHLKLPFIGVGGLQRPSKFDSGEDIINSHESLHSSASDIVGPKKASDDILRDIMRMHEQPAAAATATTRQSSLHYHTASDNQLAESPPASNSLRSAKNLLTTGPNKMVSHLISYIVSPLTAKLSPTTTDSHQRHPVLRGNISLPMLVRSSLLLTGRSNATHQSSSSSSLEAPTTGASILQKPFLALPNWMMMRTRGQSSAYSTKPSTMFGDDSNSNWMMSSSSDPIKTGDLMATDSDNSLQQAVIVAAPSSSGVQRPLSSSRQNRGNKELPVNGDEAGDKRESALKRPVGKWLKNSANHMAQNYLQDSFRGLLTLSQLPILPVGPVSTAPSVLEPRPVQQRRRVATRTQVATQTTDDSPPLSGSTSDKKKYTSDRRAKALEDLYRYAYILGTSMVGRKQDPLKALSTKTRPNKLQHHTGQRLFSQRSFGQMAADNRRQIIHLAKALQQALFASSSPSSSGNGKLQAANPRGVMWDMATDPTLVVTLMHLIERASVALPLGFLLMPVVQMIRNPNPLSGFNLGRVLPPRALHRSVEHELLAKRLDAVDKVLSRALRPSHGKFSFISKE